MFAFLAQTLPTAPVLHGGHTLVESLTWSVCFGVLGIVLTLLGFKIFDWITPHIDVEKELAEKQNIAVAIVCAAIIIGIALIMAAAIG